ncbi:MAG TPA: hypothetical protein VFJ98_05660 [Mycobacteriales bacterium]|nr:hypothetical protein [Mycobacteriales bacterium]
MTLPATPDPSRRVTITVPAWVAALRDPGVQVVVVLAGLAVVGFAMLALGWRGVARTAYVPFQLPWLVSSSLAGLAVLGFALGAWNIHLGRRQDAAHRAVTEQLVRDAAELADRATSLSRSATSGRRAASCRRAP